MEQEFKNILEKVQGDPQKVYDIIFDLGITADDLADYDHSGKIYEVVSNLASHPDPKLLVTKLTVGKPNIDRVEHLWGYFKVKEQKEQVGSQLAKTKQDFDEMSKIKNDLEAKYASLEEQESYY